MSDVPARTASMPAPASQQTNIRRRSFFYGWWVVLACAVGLFLGPPVSVFSFPVFLKPLMQDFHAGRAAVSLGFTLNLMVVAVSAPLVGWLIDHYGFAESDPVGHGNVQLHFALEQRLLGQYLAVLFLLYRVGTSGKWCRADPVRKCGFPLV
jgi:MFS family permease